MHYEERTGLRVYHRAGPGEWVRTFAILTTDTTNWQSPNARWCRGKSRSYRPRGLGDAAGSVRLPEPLQES